MQPLAIILKNDGLISVGEGEDKAIPRDLLEALLPSLTYTHVHTLFGADAYDKVTGERRNVRYEKRKLYALDGLGRLICRTGYLPRITRLFQAAGYQVQTMDLDSPKDPKVYQEDWDNVVEHFQFRARQDECLAAIAAHPLGGLIHASPGFGKSFLWAAIALLYPYANIVGTVTGIDILRGMVQDMSKYLPNVGQVGGGQNRLGRVTLYSADSLVNRAGSVRPDILLADEVHTLVAPSYAEAIAQVGQYARCYGFSANVGDRRDGADALLEGQYGPKIFEISWQEATSLDLIVPMTVIWHDVVMSENPASGKTGIWRQKFGIWRNASRNNAIADAARQYDAEEQVLIMVAKIEHAVELKRLLPEFELCYGNMDDTKLQGYVKRGLLPDDYTPLTADDRIRLRNRFRAGEAKKVIATDVWAKGVSFEALSVLIRADARASAICDTQIPGRVSRTHKDSGKACGVVHDFCDQFDEGFRRAALGRRRNYDEKGWKQIREDGEPVFVRRKNAS